jgi:hypothetical protein
MRKFVFIAACFLIFQTVVLVDAVRAEGRWGAKVTFPAFLRKPDSSVTIWKQGKHIRHVKQIDAGEILEKIAVEKG